MSFKNKVVLITGGGSGIGQATAILFAKEGADIVIVDCNEENANKVQIQCKEYQNRVLAIKTDVSNSEESKNAIDKTINYFGKLDVLVNNAGVVRVGNLLSGTIMDTWDDVININLRAVILMTNLATPHLIKTKGCIVNTSSIFSKLTKDAVKTPIYAVSKAGVDCFTRLSALELASSGIRVNSVNPGYVRTNIIKHANLDICFDDLNATSALKKCSDPQEIAELIVYLASEKAKSITGNTCVIDNGINLM